MSSHFDIKKLSSAGVLITLGIIFGDIGTSPLYVLKAIVGTQIISPDLILGGLSCIFWTLTLQTTVKYIILTLKADNKGEGGIFSLYALVRRLKFKYLVFPALIGASALLADGIITPAISVASAVEGLEYFSNDLPILEIIIAILFFLFFIQQFGSSFIGKAFGPIMLVWFTTLAVLGISQLAGHIEVLKAINPYYGYNLLVNYPHGFWLLGAVFLCTTGAEALYSDLGHCGKVNVRVSWTFVKAALLLNYFGQGAWLLGYSGSVLGEKNPFYSIMPSWFLIPGIVIATTAAIVASQALISGSFTLINEAIKLNFGPKLKVVYPTELRGQIYIPTVNWSLCAGCIGIVLFFKASSGMEAAYGLSIVIAMLSTTVLLSIYLFYRRYSIYLIALILAVFLTIEISFLIANLSKFSHGGWVTLLLTSIMFCTMYAWYKARQIRSKLVDYVKINNYIPLLTQLSDDVSIPKYSTHLIYLTNSQSKDEIETKVIYSILQKQPKRADTYFFLHVDVMDEPYSMDYEVIEFVKNKIIRINFKLGFRVEQRINTMFRLVVQELVSKGEVDIISRYYSLHQNNIIGDFRFVVIERYLSNENILKVYEKLILNIFDFMKRFGMSEGKEFGLEASSVTVEKIPLIINPVGTMKMHRVN